MRRLETHVDTTSENYRAYRAHNLALAEELREMLHRARHVRPQRALDRLAEQDKLTVRQRLDLLLDPGTPFLELMSLAANRHYDGEAPQALLVTGVGVVSGREVMVIANDSSLKGGAWYPITTRKIVRALQVALENRLPVVHMLDSGGANLHLQDEIYAWAGHIFKQQCQLSAAGIPQLAVVFGYCTAGAAYTPTLCDQTIMVRERGAIFLAGPPLVKAATGEEVTTEELGGADMHTSVSGTADYAVDTEAEACALARDVVGVWARREKADSDRRDPEPPFHDPDELYGIIPDDVKKQFEMREVIARIVDGSLFHEFKPRYGDTMVTGWAFIWGMKVGILGNNGVIYSRGRQQGGHVHAAVRPRRHPAAVHAQRDRVHGRPRVRAPRHHEGRREDADGPGQRHRAQADAAVPRLAGRRELRDGGPHVGPAPALRVAELALVDHGRRRSRRTR